MKKHTASIIACLLIPLAGLCAGERVEYGTIFLDDDNNSGAVNIPEGVLFQVVGAASSNGEPVYTNIEREGAGLGSKRIQNHIGIFRYQNSNKITPDAGWDKAALNGIVGPGVYSISRNNGASGAFILSYKLTYPTTEDSSSTDTTEAEVEVPADATGDVQVVMESSEDGKTWVLAGPGPYPAKGSKLQFRIRIVTTQ